MFVRAFGGYFSRLVLLPLAVAAVLGGGGVAYAAYCGDETTTSPSPAPRASSTVVRAGESVTVTAGGLVAGELYDVGITSGSASYRLGHDYAQTADGAGSLPPEAWVVPPVVAGGLYTLYIVSEYSGAISEGVSIEVLPAEPRPEASCSFIGGLYKNVPAATGCERHHIPSQGSFKGLGNYSKPCTPVVRMETVDHRRTASHGGIVNSPAFRGQERQLIQQGNFAGAFDKNVIEDLRPKFGAKYDAAIAGARTAMADLPSGGTSTC